MMKQLPFTGSGQSERNESSARTNSGRGFLPLLVGALALVAVGYLIRDRFGPVHQRADQGPKRVAERAEQTAEEAAEQVESTSEQVSGRIEETSEQVGERIGDSGENASETSEEEGEMASGEEEAPQQDD